MSQYSILGRVIGDEVRQTAILQGTQGQVLISDLTNVNGFSFATPTSPPSTPGLNAVLNAGASSTLPITLQDATDPANLTTTYSDTGFTAYDGTGVPQYTNATTAASVALQRSDGFANIVSPVDIAFTYPNGQTTLSASTQSLEFYSPLSNDSASYAITSTQINYNNVESQIALTAQSSPSIFIGRNNLLNTATFTPDDVSVVAGGLGSTATWANIISLTNSGTPTLSQVLSVGNSATNSLTLNNLGTASNVISLLPNASASNPTITLTDGSTTNTIDKNGYTTRNTSANSTHYINFSDSSSTGTGAIQKTAGISLNPSTNTITATTFSGALSGNATTATTATNATNVAITDDNTNATFYPVFASTNTGNLPLKVDKTTNPLSYNPSTGLLTSTTFSGALSGNATTATTATNATNVATTAVSTNASYYPTFVSATTGNNPASVDADLTYNPSTNTLTTSNLNTGVVNGASGVLLQYNGTTQSSITTNGVQLTLLSTQGTATAASASNLINLTLVTTGSAPYPTLYTNLITFSGYLANQTINAITIPSNMPINAMYMVYMTNTSGYTITINATSLGTGIKTTYTTAVVIPATTGLALGTLTKVGSATYIWSVNLVA